MEIGGTMVVVGGTTDDSDPTGKQIIVPNKKLRHKIQMTNDRPVFIVIDQW